MDGEEEDHHHHHHGTTFNATTTQVIGGGMSRAAKKRAKKKNKDKQGEGRGSAATAAILLASAGGGDDNDKHPVEETASVRSKRKEKQKIMEKEAKQHDDDEIRMKNPDSSAAGGGGDVLFPNLLKSCLKKRTTAHEHNDNNDNKSKGNNNTLPLLVDGGLTSLVKDILLVDDDDSDTNINNDTNQPPSLLLSNNKTTARERARLTLAFLLAPAGISVEEFYQDYWEKKPLHVKCCTSTDTGGSSNASNIDNNSSNSSRLDGLLSLSSIRKTLREHSPLYLGKDLNVTRYQEMEDGVKRRQTLDASMSTSSKKDTTTAQTKANQSKKQGNNDKNGIDDDDVCQQQLVADPELVWQHYEQHGCSIRLLCPHDEHFSNTIHTLLSLLELEFGCMVGANAYLTPPLASQGFAPHYDDIEAFCLQLQGHKRWKVYEPFHKAERLPRVSSGDYTEDDLQKNNANMVLDIVLSPGDVLYMPRGWIHQACTLPPSSSLSSKSSDHDKKRKRNKDDDSDDDGDHQQHSLHLTVSAMQHWSWIDLMEVLLPQAMEAAANSETSIALRQGLPRQFLSYMGAIYDNGDRDCPEPSLQLLRNRIEAQEAAAETTTANDYGGSTTRHGSTDDDVVVADGRSMEQLQQEFRSEAKKRIMRVAKEAMDMVAASCDQMAKQFVSSCQPPALTQREVQATSRRRRRLPESSEHDDNDDKDEEEENDNDHQLRLRADDEVRMVRPGIARLVVEDNMAVLYHCLDNSRVYHEKPLSPMEFEMDDAAAMEQILLTTEPNWICIADLFHDSIQDKVGVAQSLYDEGILVLRRLYEREEQQQKAVEENIDA
jgi:bifunctional lysine-specific demethylase and histidyl-hydroxylase NO66